MAIESKFTTFAASDGFIVDAYWAKAKGKCRGGLIVAMEAFGVNDHIQTVTDNFAEQGYEVLAPALYDRLAKGLLFPYDNTAPAVEALKKNGFENPLKDVQGAIQFLQKQGIDRIGIVGYCYGGAVSWLAAANLPGINAAVCYYGSAILAFPEVKPSCPTIAHWGLQDPTTPKEQVDAIAANNPDVPMYWYEANHGFNSDRPEYHGPSAELALARTLKHFDEFV